MLFSLKHLWLQLGTEQPTAFSSPLPPAAGDHGHRAVSLLGALWLSSTTHNFLSYTWQEDMLTLEQGFLQQNSCMKGEIRGHP